MDISYNEYINTHERFNTPNKMEQLLDIETKIVIYKL